jgi:hypothetical protein
MICGPPLLDQKSAGAAFFPYQPFSCGTFPVVLSSFLAIAIVPPFLGGAAGVVGEAAGSRGRPGTSPRHGRERQKV